MSSRTKVAIHGSQANKPSGKSGGLFIAGETYTGNVPHPELIKQFEEIHPGAAQKFFDYAENEQQHRHKIENKTVTLTLIGNVIGVVGTLLIGCGILAIGSYLIFLGQYSLGVTLICTVMAAFFAGAIWKNSQKGTTDK